MGAADVGAALRVGWRVSEPTKFKAVETIAAVLASSLPTTHKAVLTVYAMHANADGQAWPSVATVASRSSLGERSVQRALKALEASGWLEPQAGRWRTKCFRVVPQPPSRGATVAPPSESHPVRESPWGATVAPYPATVTPKGATVAPDPSLDPSKNPPLNPPPLGDAEATPQHLPAVRKPDPVAEAWTIWKGYRPRSGKRWPAGCEAKAAINDIGLDGLRKVLVWLHEAPDLGTFPSATFLRHQYKKAPTKLAQLVTGAKKRRVYFELAESWFDDGCPMGPAAQPSTSKPRFGDGLRAIAEAESTTGDDAIDVEFYEANP